MYYLYTDGSTWPNPGIGSWSYILIDPQGNTIIGKGIETYTTNNRMECRAIIEGLKAFKDLGKNDDITVLTDSMYCYNMCLYQEGRKNKDMIKEIRTILKDIDTIKFEWIKAHNGNYYNELVDSLAYKTLSEEYERLGKKMKKPGNTCI